MKESYGEGIAGHIGPESCARVCKGPWRSVDRGTCGPGIEPRNPIKVQGADVVGQSGRRKRMHRVSRDAFAPCAVVDPAARTETPCTGIGRSHGRLRKREPEAASGSPRTEADDGRPWEVAQLHST